MSKQELTGGCQCGDIRYTITGEPIFTAICHCTMCRRAHAAPAVAWALFSDSHVAFTGEDLKQFKSSTNAQRGFCGKCGTQINFTASFLPDLMDITIGSLDDPEAITPSLHYWHSKHISWAEFADALPRYPEQPPVED